MFLNHKHKSNLEAQTLSHWTPLKLLIPYTIRELQPKTDSVTPKKSFTITITSMAVKNDSASIPISVRDLFGDTKLRTFWRPPRCNGERGHVNASFGAKLLWTSIEMDYLLTDYERTTIVICSTFTIRIKAKWILETNFIWLRYFSAWANSASGFKWLRSPETKKISPSPLWKNTLMTQRKGFFIKSARTLK